MGTKWAEAKPAEKLLTLYSMLLFSGREASLSELSKELNCSKQSVSRLISQLEGSRFGKVLRTQRGREAVFFLERPKRLPQISLNAEGLYQLALCREFLLHLLPSAMHEEMKNSLQQASVFLPENTQDLPFGLGGSLSKGSIDYAPFQGTLEILMQAIRENSVCSVRYKSSLHGEEKSFDYAPKRLLAFRESILVTGWIVADTGGITPMYDTPTRLSLHRLTACVATKKGSGELPSLPEHQIAAFGIMGGERFSVSIRINAEAATYVAERIWSKNQTIVHNYDGSIILNMDVQSIQECISWVLSFGTAAEVMAPDWIRDRIRKTLLGLVDKY